MFEDGIFFSLSEAPSPKEGEFIDVSFRALHIEFPFVSSTEFLESLPLELVGLREENAEWAELLRDSIRGLTDCECGNENVDLSDLRDPVERAE